MSCWIRLGIEPTQDLAIIRQAYRSRLPAHHPETDPEGFQALREAYEQAQRLAREAELPAEPAAEEQDTPPHPALTAFHHLLEEPTLRFDPSAWQRYALTLDELPLDTLDDLGWQLLHDLRHCGPIAHACASLLARRFGWAEQLLRLDDAHEVEAFLARLDEPDPFDTTLMRDWPPTAQLETLWYFRSLAYCFEQRPLFEYEQFASQHTCLAIPDDAALMRRVCVQFSQAGIASMTLHAQVQVEQARAPDDPDLLYLLARQASALGAEQQALDCWLRLWREYRHPQAERWLLDLCARHQPQRLPLLIQAFDQQTQPDTWPDDLADPAQAWGSPAQAPQTLARWSEAARLELGGIAALFIDWRLDGDDELPLLAWLLQEQAEPALQRLYWQAWALQRGEAGLLQRILAERPSEDALDGLILEGFQRQARQHLHWLQLSPVARALERFCDSDDPAETLPEILESDELRPLCREWLRRVRVYSAQAVRGLNRHFEMRRLFTVPFALTTQDELADCGVLLPPMVAGEALWTWHRQQLFMLALADQPERWLALIPDTLVDQLTYPSEHPFAGLHRVLQAAVHSPEGANALPALLDNHDPMQAFVAGHLLTFGYAINSARLPSTPQLLACLDNDDVLDDHRLGYMLLCAVLYHDPALDAEQRARLRDRLDALDNDSAWFVPLRDGLTKGKAAHLPRNVLEQEEGVDAKLFNEALDALHSLANRGQAPSTRSLLRLQQGKDDGNQDAGLRCALMALLAWSERLLLAHASRASAPSWAFWRLGSRLGRGDLAAHLIVLLLVGAAGRSPAVMAVIALLVLSALLRRLRDIGQGVPVLLCLLAFSRLLPVLPLLLLGWPGDRLANRYGASPGKPQQLDDGLQAALRRLIHQ
ncbi:molecular chaperone DnaJ [Pseudomonas entomophila]|uniref:molecular chaperone DnaJ n=1 Tax=Pseudomonas entomophila TaxID=312306 RepID=UPI0023D86AA5|nr:molecular chaperone DnaJ [Pseudomonas entomophila]MDF0729951.1 molecular chaperone DnaJ [Pseudomonas entomophila]